MCDEGVLSSIVNNNDSSHSTIFFFPVSYVKSDIIEFTQLKPKEFRN